VDIQYLNMDEVSRHLHLSKSTLYGLARTKDIPSFKIVRKILFPENELNAWIESKKDQSANK
jgi:excisionase family DNA binding protein